MRMAREGSAQLLPRRLAAVLAVLLMLGAARPAFAAASEMVCDSDADFALGIEDYPAAIRLHQKVLRNSPGDALAHYHLGFAYGLSGDSKAELREYVRAQELGLNNWDFLLNFGLLRLDRGEVYEAVVILTKAAALGPRHAEAHFNLGLAYERAGMQQQAIDEISISLQLNPDQLDAQNELAAVDAEIGKCGAARAIWTRLIQSNPGYEPAAANLATLQGMTCASSNPAIAMVDHQI